MNIGALCPVCEEGHLQSYVEKMSVEYHGHHGDLKSRYSTCDACGSEIATAEETRFNKRAMIAFKKQVDGLLTGAEVRALRERLSITQAQAALIFGGGPVAFSKYESDDVMQSEPMDNLLRVVDEVPGAFEFLAQQKGVVVPRAGAVWEFLGKDFAPQVAVYYESRLRLVHSQTLATETQSRYA